MENTDTKTRLLIQEEGLRAKAQLARFVIDRTPKTAMEVVLTCASDGNETWKLFFQEGMADAISEDKELENEFFQRLCSKRGLPHSATIIDAYLSQMPKARRESLMDISNLKRKQHPVNLSFYCSTFSTQEGEYYLDVFKVFFKHGLTADKLDIVVNRCFDELVRGCQLGNSKFIEAVIPQLKEIPEALLQNIVSRSNIAEEVISIFVNKCNVPIEKFADHRILVSAKPEVAQYISAAVARSTRIPERTFSPQEDL